MRRKPAPERFDRRLWTGVIFGILVALLVAGRLVQVQVVEAGPYRERAKRQQQRELAVPAARGALLDREGEPLAFTLPADRRGTQTAKRLYPQGRLASHVLGFCNADGNGLEGLELAFQSYLTGTPGSRIVGANAKGYLATMPASRVRPSEDGASLRLTLDADAQAVLERELEACVEDNGASSATAILMDPRTGDIVAMGSYPNYDPQSPRAASVESRRNRAITDIIEPGSTFKLVTAAACLEEGVISPGTLIESMKVLPLPGGHSMHDEEDFGWVTLEETLTRSVNTATALLARKIGPEVLFQYARAFGVGCVTGIDLPGEVSGILRRPRNWSGRSLETISIGQEVAVTPLQLVSAYSAVANDGVLMKPRIVREIRDPSGRVLREFPTRRVRRVVSESTARELRRMLHEVVESGTGENARIPGCDVAGKTGTAQRVDPRTGRYDARRHVASFVGFLPADQPRLVGVVVVDRPHGVGYGGEVAAPAFRRIVEGILLRHRDPGMARAALGADI